MNINLQKNSCQKLEKKKLIYKFYTIVNITLILQSIKFVEKTDLLWQYKGTVKRRSKKEQKDIKK